MNECTNKSKRKKKTMNIEKFEEFISQYPIFEYRILDTKDITIQERVRTICQEECERYDSTKAKVGLEATGHYDYRLYSRSKK